MEKAKDKKLKWVAPMLIKLGGSVGSADGGAEAEYDCGSGSTAEGCCQGTIAEVNCPG